MKSGRYRYLLIVYVLIVRLLLVVLLRLKLVLIIGLSIVLLILVRELRRMIRKLKRRTSILLLLVSKLSVLRIVVLRVLL